MEVAPCFAFVLLARAGLPTSADIIRTFGSLAPREHRIQRRVSSPGETQRENLLELEIRPGGSALMMVMPFPVPNGEAEAAVRFSASAMGTGWTLPAHEAHLMVALSEPDSAPPLARLSGFTSLVAAVARASGAVGVYWGNAGATHDPEFFAAMAREPGLVHRIPLWTGISLSREPDGRLSLLSLGLKQLGLPNLLLIGPQGSGNSTLTTFFDLLAYLAERGEPLADGDTVGRSAAERLPVRYVPSPIDPGTQVWRVELG